MAGLGGMPYYIQDLGQLQQQAAQKQQMQLQQQEALQRQAAIQQQQQDRQRQMAAANAAGNVLPQMFAPPPSPAQQSGVPPPQPPMPGQPSQPMMQPRQGMLPPPPQGTQQGQPPMQQGMPQPQQPPPYRPMPTTPPALPSQGGMIAPPPQGQQPSQQQQGPLSFEHAVKLLSDQGLKGADLMAGLQQLQPLLDTQAKMQAAQVQQQFTNELKLQQLQNAHDNLEEKKREADQRAQDHKLDRADRAQARADSLAIRRDSLELRKQIADMGNKKATDESIDFTAERILAGDPKATVGMGRDKATLRAVNDAVAAKAKERGIDATKFIQTQQDTSATNKAKQAAGSQAGKVATAAKEVDNFAPIAIEMSDKVPRTSFVFLNKGLEAARTQTSDPDMLRFIAANRSLATAYGMAIGRGTTNVHAQQEAEKLLTSQTSPEGYKAIVGVIQREAKAAAAAPKEVIKSFGKEDDSAPAIPSGWSVKEH
jgi:hypothetical protein